MSISSFGFSAASDDEGKPRNKRRFDNKKSKDKKPGRDGDGYHSRSRRPDFDDDEFPDSFDDFDEEFDEDEDLEDIDEDEDDDFDFDDDDDEDR